MQRHIVRRLGNTVFVVLGMAVMVFFMVRVTGDPARAMMPREAGAEEVAEFRRAMGLDRPLPVQLIDFVSSLFLGDLGRSYFFRAPVLELILGRLPATLELAAAGLGFAVVVGIPLGLVAAYKPGTVVDAIARLVALIGQSAPGYWVAIVLILLFAVRASYFPAIGRGGLRSIVLPAFTVSLPTLGYLTRLTRAHMFDVLNEGYIRTARAKGVRERTIHVRHALKNVAGPLVTIVGVHFGYLVGGSVFIETVFAWPGIGQLAYQAITVRDFPLVQGVALFAGFFVAMINLVVDLIYGLIDPRIQYD